MAETTVSFEVHGLKEMEDALKEIGNAAAGKTLFSALMAAGMPIQKEAQANAPKSTEPHYKYQKGKAKVQVPSGTLKKSIGRKRLKSSQVETGAEIGISWRGRAFYGRFLEFGTSKMAAKPFLRPAFDAKKDESLTIFKDKLAENIEKQRQIIAARTAGNNP